MDGNKPLSNQCALVTGGSRGIGRAIATRLAADGAAVVVNYARNEGAARQVVEAIRAAGGEAEAVHADLGRPEGARNLFAGFDAAFGKRFAGRLDILVNNAGTSEMASILEASDESFDAMFQLNVKSVFMLAREAARRMVAAKSGRIINVGSNLGERLARPGFGVYAATKFAVAGFTKAWSHDLGPHGVTVNAVQPGPIDTDLNPAAASTADFQKSLTSVGRYGRAEEIAAAVAYLASPLAGFTNGTCLTVDGGQNA